VLGLFIALGVAALVIAGAFARLSALRRQWRDEPPPKYSKPYRRWDDDQHGR
jgi:hypothetical protein